MWAPPDPELPTAAPKQEGGTASQADTVPSLALLHAVSSSTYCPSRQVAGSKEDLSSKTRGARSDQCS